MNPVIQPSVRRQNDGFASESCRLFVPEELTPLAFTSIYHSLRAEQRCRYNQLHGYYFLEQTVFFEQHLGRPGLESLLASAPSSHLRKVIAQFIDEENRHTGWFCGLLRECEPAWYSERRFHLLKASRSARALLRAAARLPRLFPCLLWIQIITEERVQHFSSLFVRHAAGLDPRFVEVQRKHLADEGGHIRWDAELIEWRWPATPLFLRKLNARLLGWVLYEFFHLPKRSGWKVVERLIAEFPDLTARRSELRTAMRSLAANDDYLRTLYPRAVFPRTRRLATRWPELHFLEEFFTD
jgi:hypothetical protein